MLQNIEKERRKQSISLMEISGELGCSVKTYYNWIREKTDIPGSVLKKLKEILQVDSIDYLLESDQEE